MALRHLLFGTARKVSAPRVTPPLEIDLGDRIVRVKIKRHAASRRFVLRLDRDGSGFTLTMPPRQSLSAARDFINTSQGWMLTTIGKRAAPVELGHGANVMLRGRSFTIAATGQRRGTVLLDELATTIHVPGEEPHLKRRLTDWLKQEAQVSLTEASRRYAFAMGTNYKRLVVRDQKSRWGSCSSDGTLSYSWRLILAPPLVLDYVAAHEVAHLLEMNHGPRFWRLVLTHCKSAREAKTWLKRHGHTLHRYV